MALIYMCEATGIIVAEVILLELKSANLRKVGHPHGSAPNLEANLRSHFLCSF